LASKIAKSMEKKEPEPIQNGLLFPAVLLDINNMDLLSEADVEKAREATVDLVLRFQGLKDNEKEASSGFFSEMCDMDPDTDKELRSVMKERSCSAFASSVSSDKEEMEFSSASLPDLSPPRPRSAAHSSKQKTSSPSGSGVYGTVLYGSRGVATLRCYFRKNKEKINLLRHTVQKSILCQNVFDK
jgi:hypothetical protein